MMKLEGMTLVVPRADGSPFHLADINLQGDGEDFPEYLGIRVRGDNPVQIRVYPDGRVVLETLLLDEE